MEEVSSLQARAVSSSYVNRLSDRYAVDLQDPRDSRFGVQRTCNDSRVQLYVDFHDRAHFQPKLKGSVGEGPNQTNYSDRSSVRILSKINSRIFSRKLKKSQNLNIF